MSKWCPRAPWDVLGGLIGRLWDALGRSWGALGLLSGRSWALLGALGALLGRSWAALDSFGGTFSSLSESIGMRIGDALRVTCERLAGDFQQTCERSPATGEHNELIASIDKATMEASSDTAPSLGAGAARRGPPTRGLARRARARARQVPQPGATGRCHKRATRDSQRYSTIRMH